MIASIKNIILTPVEIIDNPKGEILKGMDCADKGFSGFGEAYFSAVKPEQIKGWNRHKLMTLNLIVPIGSVKFVVIDDKNDGINKNNIFEVELSIHNYQRLTIPPGLWVGFECTSKTKSFILNIADMVHDPNEIERIDLEKINYNWKSK